MSEKVSECVYMHVCILPKCMIHLYTYKLATSTMSITLRDPCLFSRMVEVGPIPMIVGQHPPQHNPPF